MIDSAYVSAIQRFCVHDGPGIRTVVFLTGCPLRCKWCENPETASPIPQLMFNAAACTNCGLCIDICPHASYSLAADNRLVYDRDKCERSFLCVEACPFQALKASSQRYTVAELQKEVMKDIVFFKNTGGGVTISGGEPLLHPDYVASLLGRLKEQGVHTAIETCGSVKWESVERVLSVVDLFLYDIKLYDSAKHVLWCRQDNRLIQNNLAELVRRGKSVVIRIPLIPGVNDDHEFEDIVNYVCRFGTLKNLHILPFHQLGSSKYTLLGQDYAMVDVREDNAERIDECRRYAEAKGLQVSIGGSG